jgi:hypothetical protein
VTTREKQPVALFCFNRPEPTKLVFEAIREYQPSVLFIIQDGPRRGNEQDVLQVEKVRELLDVSWPCKVFSRFRQENVGLIEAFNDGLNFIFSQAETCIILEDDCVPDYAFFKFMELGLQAFRSDQSVGMIHGYSDDYKPDSDLACYLSRQPKVWGWATWRDRHEGFDVKKIPLIGKSGKVSPFELTQRGFTWGESIAWSRNLNRATALNTWDYQWCFHVLLNFGFSLAPTTNLIENIGFGGQATHTRIIPPYIQFQKSKVLKSSTLVVLRNSGGWRDLREKLGRLKSLLSSEGLEAIRKKLLD